jgi:hypothetical protein
MLKLLNDMKTKNHKIRKEITPILKQMIEDKKAMQEHIKNGGTLYDIIKRRNQPQPSV